MPRFVGPQGRGAMRLYRAKKRKEAEIRNAVKNKEQEEKEELNDNSDSL